MPRQNSHCVWAGRSGAATLGVWLALLLLVAACARGQPAAGGSAPPKPGAEPAAGQPAADPRAVADFYRGKTVRVIVGFGAGGGFDTYSRLIARHIGRFIPGNPTVIVENMPGAGSLTAANYIGRVAP